MDIRGSGDRCRTGHSNTQFPLIIQAGDLVLLWQSCTLQSSSGGTTQESSSDNVATEAGNIWSAPLPARTWYMEICDIVLLTPTPSTDNYRSGI